jgi:hypothetical protein
MSYSLGKDVSTVVRQCPTELSADTRVALATDLLRNGSPLIGGDIWNGHAVTDKPDTVFFRPNVVSFIGD